MTKILSRGALSFLLVLLVASHAGLGRAQQPLPKSPPEVQALIVRAQAAAAAGRTEEALGLWNETLEKAIALGDRAGEGRALLNAGNLYRLRSRPKDAMIYLNRALELSQSLSSKRGMADALNNIGLVQKDTDDLQAALDHFQRAQALHHEIANGAGEARALANIAMIYREIGKPVLAEENYRKALPLFRAANDKSSEAEVITGLGIIQVNYGEIDTGLETLQKSVDLCRGAKNRAGEARALANTALVYRDIGEPKKAEELYNQALEIFKDLKLPAGQAQVLNGLGTLYHMTGRPDKSVKSYEEALALYRNGENQSGEAFVLTNLGAFYRDIGQPQRALEHFERALMLHKNAGNQRGEARVLNGLGLLYESMGQLDQAEAYFQSALKLYQLTLNRGSEAIALSRLGIIYRTAGNMNKALDYFRQALAVHGTMKNKRGKAQTLNSMGIVYRDTRRPEKAREYFEKALPLYRDAGDTGGEAAALSNLGMVYRATGGPEKALPLYRQAVSGFEAISFIGGEADTLHCMALAERDLRRLDEAERHEARAVELLEKFRTRLGAHSEAKTAFLSSKLYIYYAHLGLLLQLDKAKQAFEMAEMTKARALLDLLANGRIDPGAALTEDERTEEQVLRRQADLLNAQMMKEGVENETGAMKRFAALQAKLKETERQLQTYTDRLYARHPGLAQKRVARIATLRDIAAFLPPDTALLSYIQFAQDKLALFLVTVRNGDANVRVFPINVSERVFRRQCAGFRADCANPRRAYQQQARSLYAQLVGPAEPLLAGKKRLVICPDGPLWDVPFQALFDPQNRPLWERYELAYAYSATGAQAAAAEKSARSAPRLRPALVLANPQFGETSRFGTLDNLPSSRPFDTPSRPFDTPSRPFDTPSRPFDTPSRKINGPSPVFDTLSRRGNSSLRPFDTPSRPFDTPSRSMETIARGGRIAPLPGTQREADTLRKAFPDAVVYTGNQVQESTVKAEAGKYRYLHFATHGFLNDASPMLSAIVMAAPANRSGEDGFLTARELFEMRLNADMTVLSACNTGRGQARTGEGMVGLTWALFAAGCPTQIVSMWSVHDTATAELMSGFYRKLIAGKSKGEALRQAALSLRRQHRYRHPYYWSPFVLMGSWS